MTAEPKAELSQRLAGVSLFSGLDAAELEAVAGLIAPFDVPHGHILVQPGMVGAGLFLIEEGSVSLTVQGREVELGPGEFFGELALLDDRAVHTTRVRARTPVSGYCITRDDFAELLRSQPKIALTMLRVLAHRLVDLIATH